MLLDGKIDGTALDSTVLEIELKNRPERSDHLRTIATWGPSPIPPWVIRKQISTKMRAIIRSVLLGMESDVEGKAVLADLGMKRFTRVSDADYDPIREMALKARRVHFGNK
jgi:phosphonate transport system substrate-binding protein